MVGPTDMITIFFVIEKLIYIFLFSLPTLIIFLFIFFRKEILGYGRKQYIDYPPHKIAKCHITYPKTIMYGVQKILKFLIHNYY